MEPRDPRPSWVWKRKLVIGAVVALVALLVVALAIFVLVFRKFGDTTLREDGCDLPLAKQHKCFSWDGSFQDPLFYQVAWGQPKPAVCARVLRSPKKAKATSKGRCAWEMPAGWEADDCVTYGIEPRYKCFSCVWAAAAMAMGGCRPTHQTARTDSLSTLAMST